MGIELAVDLELDVMGQRCPIPMVRVGTEIENVPVGGILRVLATDPVCMEDIPAWAHLTENELVSAEEVGGEYVLLVRRLR